MRKLIPLIPGLLVIASLAACSWMGIGHHEDDGETLYADRSPSSLRTPIENGEISRDEAEWDSIQTITCSFRTHDTDHDQVKSFKFHFDLDQVKQSSWAERVNVGNGMEVYVNLWSFHEYTLGLRDVRAPASTETRLTETKGVWSATAERTMGDLNKINFQAKLFHNAGGKSFEIRCPE